MRLIDADKAVEQINEWLHQTRAIPLNTSYHFELLGCIKDSPTIDAEPVVRGEWVDLNRNYSFFVICGACKGPHFQKSKYCPNCGAKMEVES